MVTINHKQQLIDIKKDMDGPFRWEIEALRKLESEREKEPREASIFWKEFNKLIPNPKIKIKWPGRPRAEKQMRNNLEPNSNNACFQYSQESKTDAREMGGEAVCSPLISQTSKQTGHKTRRVVNSHLGQSSLQMSSEKKSSGQSGNPEINATSKGKIEDSARVHNIQKSNKSIQNKPEECVANGEMLSKVAKFKVLLESELLNIDKLRHLSWSGVPETVRPITWRLLAGYLPARSERRQTALVRKRLDYWNLVKQYFKRESDDEDFKDTYRQIHIDVPRMNPHLGLFKQEAVREMFERILFIWAIRHPASGYVQGMNDLVTPFLMVFLQEVLPDGEDLDNFEVNTLLKKHQENIEADSFWCLSKFLDGIQDNYIFAQLGIQRKVNQLKELIQRIDNTLHDHLQWNGVDYLQFSFRWMNNLLTREIPLCCSIRLWDTYLADVDNFALFHLYVCAAFLLHWRQELLLQQDFQGVMLTLQNLPTHNWTEKDIGILIAEAYRLKFTFDEAQKTSKKERVEYL